MLLVAITLHLAKAILKNSNLKELILVGIINKIKREIRLFSKAL